MRGGCFRLTQMTVWRLKVAPFPDSLNANTPKRPIITIPIPIYRCGDGDDVKEGGAELHPDDRTALEAIRDALAKYEFEPIPIIGCISERVIYI
jgi:hypothetical protein